MTTPCCPMTFPPARREESCLRGSSLPQTGLRLQAPVSPSAPVNDWFLSSQGLCECPAGGTETRLLHVCWHGNHPRQQASVQSLCQVRAPFQSASDATALSLFDLLSLSPSLCFSCWHQGGKRSRRVRGPQIQQQPVCLHLHLGPQHRPEGTLVSRVAQIQKKPVPGN